MVEVELPVRRGDAIDPVSDTQKQLPDTAPPSPRALTPAPPSDEHEAVVPIPPESPLAVVEEPRFPYIQTALISSMNLINSASYNSTMPMVPFMVLHFMPGIDESEIGFYSGLLEGMFHIGSFIGALGWGWFSDLKGRRSAMLWGLFGTMFSALMFGMSGTYGQALVAKFFWGMLNGNVGVTKTAISELTTEKTAARAFSFIGIATGLGRLIGPAIGGLLSEPATKYPSTFGCVSLFETFPYLLPCMALAALTASVQVCSYFWLKETLPPEVRRARALEQEAESSQNEQQNEENEAAILMRQGRRTNWLFRCARNVRKGCQESRRMLLDRVVCVSTVLYTLLSLVAIVSSEIYPLYLLNGPEHGGFNYTGKEIGLLATICGPILMVWQAFVYDKLVKYVGLLKTLRIMLAIAAVLCVCTPLGSLTANSSPNVQWAVVTVLFVSMVLARVSSFTCVFVIVANSALPKDRGKVNGVGQAMASAARAVAPPIGTALFAWSISDGVSGIGWPIDYTFMWNVVAMFSIATLATSYFLPKWIERKRLPTDTA